jgi:hypothetical protein
MRTWEQLCRNTPYQSEIVTQGTKTLGSQDIDKLTQIVLDKKAEMGSICKAMIRSGISFDKSPNEQKQKEPSATG